jgi:hypothetical protein
LSEVEELELTDEQLERNDEIENAVYDCICTLTEVELKWDTQMIFEVIGSIKQDLAKYKLSVRHPSICEDLHGVRTYEEYEDGEGPNTDSPYIEEG